MTDEEELNALAQALTDMLMAHLAELSVEEREFRIEQGRKAIK